MDEKFSIPFENTHLIGDILSKNSTIPNVLVLHGAGQASRARYRGLREFLLEKKIGSCVFDCIGVGDTGGEMSTSSLVQRTEQAIAVIENQRMPEPLTLIGASMGAYTALKISEIKKTDRLILIVPGVYSREAYSLKFDASFSEAIREHKSWLDSDAWEILGGYDGKLLIIGAGEDRTVPRELTQKIFYSAKTNQKELYWVPNAPHQLMLRYLENDLEQKKIVFDKILNCTI